MMQCVRSIFQHAHDARLLPLPVCFGPGFARPSKKVQRLHKAEHGPKLFTAEEVRRMLDAAGGPALKAILLLGINGGLGNAEVGRLSQAALDLHGLVEVQQPVHRLDFLGGRRPRSASDGSLPRRRILLLASLPCQPPLRYVGLSTGQPSAFSSVVLTLLFYVSPCPAADLRLRTGL
jgi:hypothetical protein